MTLELRWIVSTSASCLHAAAALLAGAALVDKKISAALAGEVEGLGEDLAAAGLTPRLFFEHAIGLAARFDTPMKWAEVLVVKTLGPQATAERITARLAQRLVALEAAFQQANPRALDELELRGEPLREQWAARGPGLIAALARLTTPDLIVSEADAILVQPVLGGAGAAHELYNSVSIEAVLANPIAELPEVLRLGWLLAQLNLDLPRYREILTRDRPRAVGSLAMIPAVLAAAQEVELAQLDKATLATALAAWHVESAESEPLWEWWETYQATSVPWTVALGALDRMLAAEPPDSAPRQSNR